MLLYNEGEEVFAAGIQMVKKIKLVLILVLVVVNGFNIFFSWNRIIYPFDMDIGEGFVLNASRQASRGEIFYYANPDENFHKISAFYPPIYYLLTGFWIKSFGVNFFGGRLISFVSNYLSAFLIFLILLRLIKDRLVSMMIGLIFPLLLPITYWGQLMRVDSLGLFLAMLALYLIVSEKTWQFYISAVVLVLAFFTKYNFASLVVPVFLVMLMTKEAKWFLYLLEFFLLALGSFMFVNKMTGGAYFLNTFTYLGSSDYSLEMAIRFMVYFFLSYSFITLVLMFFLTNVKRFVANTNEYLILFYWLTLIPFLVFSMGKAGSDMNHLFELCAASLIILGLVLGKKWGKMENPNGTVGGSLFTFGFLFPAWFLGYYFLEGLFYKLLVFLISVIFILMSTSFTKLNRKTLELLVTVLIVTQVSVLLFKPLGLTGINLDPYLRIKNLITREEYDRKIVEILKEHPGPVLSKISGWVVLSGNDSVFEPFIFNNLYRNNIFNPNNFLERVADKKYSVIVMHSTFENLYRQGDRIRTAEDDASFFSSREFIKAATDNYDFAEMIGSFIVLYPKKHQ